MLVKAGFHGSLTVPGLPPARQGDERDIFPFRQHANSARGFIAVHVGHPDVYKGQMGLKLGEGDDRRGAP